MSTRDTMRALASAMTSTDAIASDADNQVDPHNSANCTIDFVSSSMKPAPRKKKWKDRERSSFDVRRASCCVRRVFFGVRTKNEEPRTTKETAARDTAR